MRKTGWQVIWIVLGLGLSGCGRPGTAHAPAAAALSFEDALARVHKSLPHARYIDGTLLASSEAEANTAAPAGPPVHLRIGLGWVLNDQMATWYIGIEKGFYREAGLELELVPGGPGKDPLQLLVGGKLDIAVPDGGVSLVELMASPTSTDLVAIGTILKSSPYCWLGIDQNTPKDQASPKKLRPADLVGKRIGLQAGSEVFIDYLSRQYHLPADSFHIMRAGFTPDVLLAGTVDYYGAFIVNQPRIIERAGYKNWTAFRFADWGWVDFANISVVRRETFDQRAEVLRGYLHATGRALRFILDHPDEAAQITARRSIDVPLTPEMVRRRFDLERSLIEGAPGSPLQQMPPEDWDTLAAHLLQSGVINLP